MCNKLCIPSNVQIALYITQVTNRIVLQLKTRLLSQFIAQEDLVFNDIGIQPHYPPGQYSSVMHDGNLSSCIQFNSKHSLGPRSVTKFRVYVNWTKGNRTVGLYGTGLPCYDSVHAKLRLHPISPTDGYCGLPKECWLKSTGKQWCKYICSCPDGCPYVQITHTPKSYPVKPWTICRLWRHKPRNGKWSW